MPRKRRVLGSKFKAKVALAAIGGDKTLAQLTSQFDVNSNQISAWKTKLLTDASELFEDGWQRRDEVNDEELFAQIGRLKMASERLPCRKGFHVGKGSMSERVPGTVDRSRYARPIEETRRRGGVGLDRARRYPGGTR